MRRPKIPLQISERKALLVFMDLLLVNGATLLALWLWTLRDPQLSFSPEYILSQAHWFLVLTALWLFLATLNSFYNLRIADYLRLSGAALVRIIALVLLIYLGIYFVAPRHALPRLFILYFGVVSFSLVGLWRAGYILLLSRTPFQRQALIVGAGWAGRTIARAIRESLSPGYHLVGFVDDDLAKQAQVIEDLPVLGTRRGLVTLVRANDVAEVILAITHDVDGELLQILMNCQEQGVAITPMTALYEELTGRVPVEHIGDAWYIALPLDHAATGGFYPLVKRVIDVVVAIVGLSLFAFLFPLISLALYLDSPGPIVYTQERVGRGGRVYKVIKLRTMVPDAEHDQAVWAQEHDPRITRVGRILRKTRLDEFPQFINILRGEMSAMGPRPERPELVAELEKQIPFYRLRHAVKPGMAGWAMLHQDYVDSVEDALIRLQYDLYYIKHQSIWLDVLILLRTLGKIVMLKGR
jgi:exopolysaccharide biosynthesis polyprenyl glycosylphosphotransferase